MNGDEERRLLRRYAQETAPTRERLARDWKRIHARVVVGDPGPMAGRGFPAVKAIGAVALAVATVALVVATPAGNTARRDGGVQAARPVVVPNGAPGARHLEDGCGELDAEALAGAAAGDAPRHLVQPGRAHRETVPASRLADGAGAVLDLDHLGDLDPGRIVAALAADEIRSVEVLLPWGLARLDGQGLREPADARVRRFLRACRHHGVRPALHVYAHGRAGSPFTVSHRRIARSAGAGDRTLLLDDAAGLVVGRSGAAVGGKTGRIDTLITAIDGAQVKLSRPLARALAAGSPIEVVTLKHAPFTTPGDASFGDTLRGWTEYLDLVADIAADELGTRGAHEKGFDVVLWHAATWAADFLFAGRYHDPPPPPLARVDPRQVVGAVIDETARHMDARPDRYAGVRLVNGLEAEPGDMRCDGAPARVAAVRRANPGAAARPLVLDADGRVRESLSGAPYPTESRLAFPEMAATALTDESVTDVLFPQGARHCPLWLTGRGIDVRVLAPSASPARAARLQAKVITRQYSFFLHEGAGRVAVAAVPSVEDAGDDRAPGLIPAARVASLSGRPVDATAVPPSPLAALARLIRATVDGGSPSPRRALELRRVADCHGRAQLPSVRGAPPLLHRAALAVLPFQSSAHRFAVHVYVMTRDVAEELAPEHYELTFGGVRGERARVSAHDPIDDAPVAVEVLRRAGDAITIRLAATDHPRVVVIDDGAAVPP